MPPVSPTSQGSRAGLITSLVIFVVLFVTATVFAIYFSTQWKQADAASAQTLRKYSPAVNEADLGTADVQQMITAGAATHATAVRTAVDQRNTAVRLLTGNEALTIDVANDETQSTVDAVKKNLKTAGVSPELVAPDNVLKDLQTLSSQLVIAKKALADADARTKAANEKVTAAINDSKAALAEKDNKIVEAQKGADDAKADAAKRQAEIDANVDAIKKSSDGSIADSQKQLATAQAEVTKLTANVKKLQDQLERMQATIGKYRLDPSKALLQSAGVIVRVPGANTVYINLGQGQQISPGLTFEVYDKNQGLPPLTAAGNAENDLPAGKASIEVIRILPGTSECRVIKSNTSVPIVEGDLILNLVYNTHTKFTFVVYGDFDLANSGQATPGDAEVIRRLVTQWGGRLNDQVNVDTDFVVLGKEPVVPTKPENASPLDEERIAKAQAAYDAYIAKRSEAIRLNVPILNQNRFLYFVGYYDQATR